MSHAIYESPLGALTLVGEAGALRHLYFPGRAPRLDGADHAPADFAAAMQQLSEYFAGQRRVFDLRLELSGTAFQQRVWRALAQIPYGATTTYGAIARELGPDSPSHAHVPRAVGAAVGRTPVPIVVPCHRVLGADGSLTGYGGGLDRKRALLTLEAGNGDGHSDGSALAALWPAQQLALL